MVFDKFKKIKDKYYELNEADDIQIEAYNRLKEEYLELGIQVPELKKVQSEDTFAYVWTDTEYEDPTVIILEKDNDRNRYMDKIADAIAEYYSCSSFHDEITGLGPKDLIQMIAEEYKIPIVAYYECAGMINVRWLRSICE